MKEQTENKNANGHFFQGRPKRLTLVLIVILALSIIALVVFLYLHKQKEKNTPVVDANNTPGNITAVDNTTPTNTENGKINDVPATKTAVEYYNEGQTYMTAQSWNSAIEDFNLAIAIDTQVPNYYNRKSQAQYNLGQKDKAIATLKEGLVANPNSDLLRSRLDILQKDYIGSQPQ